MSRPGPAGDALRGADPDVVRRALADGDPLPGTAGFAGRLGNTPLDRTDAAGPALVRDVLGREPLFFDAAAADPAADGAWARDPVAPAEPVRVGAGTVRTRTGEASAWSLPDPPADEPDAALGRVETALADVLGFGDADGTAADRTPGTPDAVAFSGGVDSALVAAAAPDAPLYVAGFAGSHDVAAAREAAAAMDRDLTVVELDHDDLRRAVPAVAAATGRTNPMDLGIALPLYLTAERAAADGHDRLGLGQGADELFGGYAKVVDPADDARVDADTVRGARRETVATLPGQLERDVLALRAAGVEPVTPLLHDRVVAAALRLPGALLAEGGRRKVALREAARGRVPEPVRTADKKAVQYGTYVSRELDRLARRNGYKRRMDDHVGQYVRALVAEADVDVPNPD